MLNLFFFIGIEGISAKKRPLLKCGGFLIRVQIELGVLITFDGELRPFGILTNSNLL